VPDIAGPIPLADARPGSIRVPERGKGVQPTGRSESPVDQNNRAVGSE
jgi:hypothetical protein